MHIHCEHLERPLFHYWTLITLLLFLFKTVVLNWLKTPLGMLLKHRRSNND